MSIRLQVFHNLDKTGDLELTEFRGGKSHYSQRQNIKNMQK